MLTIKASACIYYNEPPERFGFTTNDPWPAQSTQNERTPEDSNPNLSQMGGGESGPSLSNSETEENQPQADQTHQYESDRENEDAVNTSQSYRTEQYDSTTDEESHTDHSDSPNDSGNISSDEDREFEGTPTDTTNSQ